MAATHVGPSRPSPAASRRSERLRGVTSPDPALLDLAAKHSIATDYWDWQGQHVAGHGRDAVGGARRPRRRRGHAGAGRAALRAGRRAAAVAPGAAADRRRPRGLDAVGARPRHRTATSRGRADRARGRRRTARCGTSTTGSPPREVDGRAGRPGHRRAAGRPAAGLAPAARRPRTEVREPPPPCWSSPGRLPLPGGARARPGVGRDDPALPGALRAVRGASATSPTWPRWRAGPPARAPTSCWSTRCTRPSRSPPIEASPYLPTTRRFANPLVPPDRGHRRVRRARRRRPAPRSTGSASPRRLLNAEDDARPGHRLGRPSGAALELLFEAAAPSRERSPPGGSRREPGLDRFATWCALAEVHGAAARTGRPPLRGRRARRGGGVRRRARRPGDLPLLAAVARWPGSSPTSSGWPPTRACRSASSTTSRSACTPRAPTPGGCATRSRAGSPSAHRPTSSTSSARTGRSRPGTRNGSPSSATRRSATWSGPCSRDSGGLRIDHVIGLFRLWWIPDGAGAGRGRLRALRPRGDDRDPRCSRPQRAGAVVIGEDLGVVEPSARDYLRERGVLGTSILWFEWGDDGRPAGARVLARAVPGHRHHPRPAADGGLPRLATTSSCASGSAC